MSTDPRKISIYLPKPLQEEITREAKRLERSVSWLVQRCIRNGLEDLKKMPAMPGNGEAP